MATTKNKDQRCKTTMEDRWEILRLRGEGWTYRALARHFGLSLSRVASICYELAGLGQDEKQGRDQS